MPDAHAGYRMPIGGVLFADGAVVPYAIGVDIGCGVVLVETDLTVEALPKSGLAPLRPDRMGSWDDSLKPTNVSFGRLAASPVVSSVSSRP